MAAPVSDDEDATGEDIERLRAAQAAAPDDWQASGRLGAALARRGEWAEAEPLLRAGIGGAPEGRGRPWRLALAEALVHADRPGEALDLLQSMLGADSARAHARLGRLMAEHGNLDGAAAALQSALALDPENRRLRKQLEDVAARRMAGRDLAEAAPAQAEPVPAPRDMPVIIETALPPGAAIVLPPDPSPAPAPIGALPVPSAAEMLPSVPGTFEPVEIHPDPGPPTPLPKLPEFSGGFPQATDPTRLILDLEPDPPAVQEAPRPMARSGILDRVRRLFRK